MNLDRQLEKLPSCHFPTRGISSNPDIAFSHEIGCQDQIKDVHSGKFPKTLQSSQKLLVFYLVCVGDIPHGVGYTTLGLCPIP